MEQAIVNSDCMGWVELLLHIRGDMTQQLAYRIESRLIDLIPSFKSAPVSQSRTSDGGMASTTDLDALVMTDSVNRLLLVLYFIISSESKLHHSAPEQPLPSLRVQPSLAPFVVHKLVDILAALSDRDAHSPAQAHRATILEFWLPLVLRLVLHVLPPETRPMPIPTPSSAAPVVSPSTATPVTTPVASRPLVSPTLTDNLRARALLALAGSVQELTVSDNVTDARRTAAVIQHVFDTASILSDSLAEDMREACLRHLQRCDPSLPLTASLSDRRLCYLFSCRPLSPIEHFALATRSYGSGTSFDRRISTAPATTDVPPSPAAGNMAAVSAKIGAEGPRVPATDASRPGRLTPFFPRRWEILNEPTPNVGENDTTLSLTLFDAIKTV